MSYSEDFQYEAKEFFGHYYDSSNDHQLVFAPLKDKYKTYKQLSYSTPKSVQEVNFLKKFKCVCNLMSYVGQFQPQKMEVLLIQNLIQQIYDQYQLFFEQGGWKIVKNKSMNCKLQEFLLLKLSKLYSRNKVYGSLDRLVVSFFYTLNYFKTCNYEIRLFNDFLLNQEEMDSFFLFIVLKKKSKRQHRDLVINSQYVSKIISIIKSEKKESSGMSNYPSQSEQLGTVKLLLIYTEIKDYISSNNIVLHEAIILNLMNVVGMIKDSNLFDQHKLNWSQFANLYFSKIYQMHDNNSYEQRLINDIIKKNLQLSNKLFPERSRQTSQATYQDNEPDVSNRMQVEQFLQESFILLINTLENIFSNKKANEKLRNIYERGILSFQYNVFNGASLIKQIFKSSQYYELYEKHKNLIVAKVQINMNDTLQ